MNFDSIHKLNTRPTLSTDLNERLVTLCDGRSGLRSGLQVEISEPSSRPEPAASIPGPQVMLGTGATLDFIASDETLDRCEEIIAASGWRLDSYRRNPVFQNAHQYGDVIFTLGKALLTEVRVISGRPSLFQRVQFAVEANPMARIAHALYKGKFLNAVSVGFIPLRWENGDAETHRSVRQPFSATTSKGWNERAAEGSALPEHRHASRPSFRRRYLEQELLEVSAVGIPANPNALQLGLKAGAIEKKDLTELLELLDSLRYAVQASPATFSSKLFPLFDFGSSMAARDTHARASGVRGYEAQLLQLAREARYVLRNT